MLKPGIIVSIQGYQRSTIEELTRNAFQAGAVAVRTDKPISSVIPVIGLQKIRVMNNSKDPYITPTLSHVKNVRKWAYIIAIDYRKINENLAEISEYCKRNNLTVIADIETIADYENIMENDYYHNFVATTFSVFHTNKTPDIELVRKLKDMDCENIIAEGNYSKREDVISAYNSGAKWVCIGSAISNIYKLTKRFTKIEVEHGKQ